MWFGPVFQAEMFRSARRPWFFIGRVIYGLTVLIIVNSVYYSMAATYSQHDEIPIAALAEFGQAIFSAFAALQGVIVLTMTPPMVAGAIADEHQRKTLHYLMASELTSWEIVVGKLAARLLRLSTFGAIGLPVLGLVALFGGIDLPLVCLVYGATASTAFFLAASSMVCSVHASKPREAIMQGLLLEVLWLSVPSVMLSTMDVWSPFWRSIGEFSRPVIEWFEASSPTSLLRKLPAKLFSPDQLIQDVCWMIGLQIGYGLVLVGFAAWRLRPVFRGQDRGNLWARIFGRKSPRSRRQIWSRPECGDDAMLWKEMHCHRTSQLRRLVLILMAIIAVGMSVYGSWDLILGAIHEASQEGFWNYGRNQRELNSLLRGANAVSIIVLILGLAAVSASSITSERESDTWLNLTSAPLTGSEIIRGKILGSLWTFRSVTYFLVASWVFGLLVGAIHPLGLLAGALELSIFAWFVAALGVSTSLWSKTTIRAMTLTIGILLFTNFGYLSFSYLIFSSAFRNMTVLAGCMPFLFTAGLVGVADLRQNWSGFSGDVLAASLIGSIAYAFAALILTSRAIISYDSVVDRPKR